MPPAEPEGKERCTDVMENSFKDRFSSASPDYRRYRPAYPASLFRYLSSLTKYHDAAWDCATGNGQCAVALGDHYDRVYATDASSSQIHRAIRRKNVSYAVSEACGSGLAEQSVDIVTVAQALHWFANEAFYREVSRVLKKNGVIAAWAYGLPVISPKVDALVRELYSEITGGFWEPEIRHIDSNYRDLPFPFREIAAPPFSILARWTFEELKGYLGTWSAVAAMKSAGRGDPLNAVLPDLVEAWGAPPSKKNVLWSLVLRIGRPDR